MEGMVMRFIPGRTVRQTDFETSAQLGQFAKFLNKLHSSKKAFPLARSPFYWFHDFLLKGEFNKITYPARFSEIKALMQQLEATFKLNPVPQTPAHLDLHPLNIMQLDQRLFLVDWVNGGISDPYLDLATFTAFQCLNGTQTRDFLTHYFERPPTSFE